MSYSNVLALLRLKLALMVLILVAGCASKVEEALSIPPSREPIEPSNYSLLIKSNLIRFNDFAILRGTPHTLELDLYQIGRYIGSLIIKEHEICFINKCLSKWLASKEFFGKVAYADLFEDILLGRDIFENMGIKIDLDAVIQDFYFSNEHIYYERTNSKTYFKNLTTGVTIILLKR